MADQPQISDAEIIDGWRRAHADAGDVRLLKRRRLRPTAGLTGSYFERVRLRAGGEDVAAILKLGGLPFGPPTRERLFFAELASGVPLRTPRPYAVGPQVDGADSWILMEVLPKAKRLVDWSPAETRSAIRNLAALHAQYLGDPPSMLGRPFTRDLEHTLSFIPEGVRKIRERYAELPGLPRIAGERTLDLATRLAAQPEVLREAFARSPETLLHGDYHRGNLIARDGHEQIVFDWQFVCAGPPAYDLAVFWLYLGMLNKPGLFGFFDRLEMRERELTWRQVTEIYSTELSRLRPDADIEAIAASADAAIACESIRQLTYFGYGIETFIGMMRFAYRDHRKVGGFLARWIGVEDGWRTYSELYRDFDDRAERLLEGHGVAV